MNSVIALGKFERVPLTKAWPTEDGNFTPWLADPGVISLLGEALGMELEVEAVEHWVGSFRADILARATDETDHRALIENQFGRTDHKHLGQILTYLAGIEGAKTIVWIAETIQPDHRAAIDWLNTNTVEDFSFFAIEVELWQINASPPAPRFNVIASPNDWTRRARSAARSLDNVELATRHKLRLSYWASFADFLSKKGSSFRIRRDNKNYWFNFSIGRTGFLICVEISFQRKTSSVGLYMRNDPSKRLFKTLLSQKKAIETEFGEALDWRELTGKKSSWIGLSQRDIDPNADDQREKLHRWMLSKMDKFKKVFEKRVKAIPVEPDDGSEPEEPERE
jgi:hypothetical protein